VKCYIFLGNSSLCFLTWYSDFCPTSPAYSWTIFTGEVLHILGEQHPLLPHLVLRLLPHLPSLLLDHSHR
jgi:hypothetical protein